MEQGWAGSKRVSAGTEYKAKGFKRLFLGRLYRPAWTHMIEAPYLDLDTTFGGLRVLKMGGGVQTQSLKFSAKNGKSYVFRSVNKNPLKALPYEMRIRFFSRLARESTATQHPYGAIAVSQLLKHTKYPSCQSHLVCDA